MGDIGEALLPQIVENGKGLILQCHKLNVRKAVVIHVLETHAHSGNELPVLGERDVGVESDFLKLSPTLIVEQRIIHLVIGDEDVHPSVQVEIRDARAHAFSRMSANAGLGGNVPERSVAVVEEELIGGGPVEKRVAVIIHALGHLASPFGGDVPGHVVDYEEVEQPVVVYIQPRAAHRPQRAVLRVGLVQPGFFSDIGKGAVAVVMIKLVAMHAADENILIAVVIVIADGNPVRKTGAREPGFFRDVPKIALAVVFKKPVEVFGRGLLQGANVGAVGEVDVQVAVVVVIEYGHAPGHGFGSVALRCLATVQAEVDGLIYEVDGRGRGHHPAEIHGPGSGQQG
jgi:hypothetical protein